jgi:4,5-DOPA dioxygenase extradiol
MLAFAEGSDRVVAAWQGFSLSLSKKPSVIIALSAHTQSSRAALEINVTPELRTWHDFGGFPRELYDIQYPAHGSPEWAEKIQKLLQTSPQLRIPVELVARPRVDHGIWVPLLHLFPKADVPIVILSLPADATGRDYLALGQALAPLRDQGALIFGTGGATHNLGKLQWHQKNSAGDENARNFEKLLIHSLKTADVEALVHLEHSAEFAEFHPTAEHFYPLLFALGAAQKQDRAEIIHQGVEYGCLSMLSFTLRPAHEHRNSSSSH